MSFCIYLCIKLILFQICPPAVHPGSSLDHYQYDKITQAENTSFTKYALEDVLLRIPIGNSNIHI